MKTTDLTLAVENNHPRSSSGQLSERPANVGGKEVSQFTNKNFYSQCWIEQNTKRCSIHCPIPCCRHRRGNIHLGKQHMFCKVPHLLGTLNLKKRAKEPVINAAEINSPRILLFLVSIVFIVYCVVLLLFS